MQTTINGTPVWITKRDIGDIHITELIDTLETSSEATLLDFTPYELYEGIKELEGYYFACCSPGCLPDSDFNGPYKTEKAALKAAKEYYND